MTSNGMTCVSGSLKMGKGIFKYERRHKNTQYGGIVNTFSFLKAQNEAKYHNKVHIYIRIQPVEHGK